MSRVDQPAGFALASGVQHPVTFAWVVRRLALGAAILFVAIGSLAWLTHASIQEAGAQLSPAETATTP